MSCFGSTLSISLENILRKVRCVLACCGGKVIIQNSELNDGGEGCKESSHEVVLQHQ